MGFNLRAFLRLVYDPASDLTEHERVVAACLAYHADQDGRCWPKVPTLAAECGVSARTVRAALRGLEQRGWIVTEPRLAQASVYTITAGRESTPDSAAASEGTPARPADPAAHSDPAPHAGAARHAGPAPHAGEGGTTCRPTRHDVPPELFQGTVPENRDEEEAARARARTREDREADIVWWEGDVRDDDERKAVAAVFSIANGNQLIESQLLSFHDDGLSWGVLVLAARESLGTGNRFKHTLAILRDWASRGVRTVEQAKVAMAEHRARLRARAPARAGPAPARESDFAHLGGKIRVIRPEGPPDV